MNYALNKTDEMVGKKIRAWDFEPCPGRDDRFVEGTVVRYARDTDHLVIEVEKDTTGMERTFVYTAPFGHSIFDLEPVVPGHARIAIL